MTALNAKNTAVAKCELVQVLLFGHVSEKGNSNKNRVEESDKEFLLILLVSNLEEKKEKEMET